MSCRELILGVGMGSAAGVGGQSGCPALPHTDSLPNYLDHFLILYLVLMDLIFSG